VTAHENPCLGSEKQGQQGTATFVSLPSQIEPQAHLNSRRKPRISISSRHFGLMQERLRRQAPSSLRRNLKRAGTSVLRFFVNEEPHQRADSPPPRQHHMHDTLRVPQNADHAILGEAAIQKSPWRSRHPFQLSTGTSLCKVLCTTIVVLDGRVESPCHPRGNEPRLDETSYFPRGTWQIPNAKHD
jgi:hypothetical protein